MLLYRYVAENRHAISRDSFLLRDYHKPSELVAQA
nr:MAG TPA: protein of unknown function DUF393 [Caudoviricetes sp.]